MRRPVFDWCFRSLGSIRRLTTNVRHRMKQPMIILPCPFCGTTKITIEWEPCPPLDSTETNRRWFAECTQCSCQGPFCQKEPQVIPAWNKRTKYALLAMATPQS